MFRRTVTHLVFSASLIASLYAQSGAPKISRPGEYSGYSAKVYDGWLRSSEYVTVRDGTRLAVDIYRPSASGAAVQKPYPVLFQMTQYRRAWTMPDGSIKLIAQPMLEIVKYGYVVIVADSRGEGASFGTRHSSWDETEALDARDLIEWSAKQPWSSGKVGMWGGSYMGGIQFLTAARQPAHLKAIFPQVSPFNIFDSWLTIIPPAGPLYEPGNPDKTDIATVPVDGDQDKSQIKAAIEQHRVNKLVGPLPYRDSEWDGVHPYNDYSASGHVPAIEKSGVAIYNVGFGDNWLRSGAIQGYINFRNPSRLALLAANPMEGKQSSFDLLAEQLRFFDHWLKDMNNGIEKEKPVYFVLRNTADSEAGRSSTTWPPPSQPLTYFFGPEHALLSTAPTQAGRDSYTVQYALDYKERDSGGLAYTSLPLEHDIDVAGSAKLTLHFASSSDDNDLYAYIECVHPDGSSDIATEGKLRVSYRFVTEPPYRYAGQPWHRGNKSDVRPLPPGEQAVLQIELLPIAYRFRAGDKVRVVLTGAAPRNAPPGTGAFRANTPEIKPAPILQVIWDRSTALELPVLKN